MKQVMKQFKSYEELEFRDDFMFGKVMQDKQLCHDVLECLLQRPVGELEDIVPQREFRYTSDGKPIRLDIYTKDGDNVYDAEMQNKGHKSIEELALPKRSRFYQSSIDMDHMDRGNHYKTLPESTVLFICTFDPFKKGLFRYTFREHCDEDNEIILQDGTIRIFYNCTYSGEDIPQDLKELFGYVETGETSGSLSRRINEAVHEARRKEEWRSAYMKEIAIIMDAKEEGREEERINTERERRNAEHERQRADRAEARVKELEALLTKSNRGR